MGLSAPQSLTLFSETLIGGEKLSVAPRYKRILDVGCGMGQAGLAARVFGFSWHKLFDNPSAAWDALVVDAIDVNENTILPYHKHIYNDIHVGYAIDILGTTGTYDLVWCGDCLEHMYDDVAKKTLLKMWDVADDLLLLSFPTSQGLASGCEIKHGGPCGAHLSAWNPSKVSTEICRNSPCAPVAIWFVQCPQQYVVWVWRKKPAKLRNHIVPQGVALDVKK